MLGTSNPVGTLGSAGVLGTSIPVGTLGSTGVLGITEVSGIVGASKAGVVELLFTELSILLKKFSNLNVSSCGACGVGWSKKLKNFPVGSTGAGAGVGDAVDCNNWSILATGFSGCIISWALFSIASIFINPGATVALSGIWTTSSGLKLSGILLISGTLFILSISSSNFLTVNLSFIILFNISTCFFSSFIFNNDLACLSDILFSNNASWTSSDKLSNLSVLAIADCDLPTFLAKSSWLMYPISNIFL